MNVDGRKLAEERRGEVRREVSGLPPLTLAVIVSGTDAVTQSYIKIKKKAAADLGVAVIDCASIEDALVADGIILQLPLPPGADVEREKNKIPIEKDVDVLSDAALKRFAEGEFPPTPPVPAAMKYILDRYDISYQSKKVAVVGFGRLVGRPAKTLFEHLGAIVTVADKGDDVRAITKDADIVILGTGVAGILKPDMVKNGVIILDAGASELGGKVVGDADPACAEKAALFTPVPGGLGPIAVTEIFANLVTLKKARP